MGVRHARGLGHVARPSPEESAEIDGLARKGLITYSPGPNGGYALLTITSAGLDLLSAEEVPIITKASLTEAERDTTLDALVYLLDNDLDATLPKIADLLRRYRSRIEAMAIKSRRDLGRTLLRALTLGEIDIREMLR